jgi:predicted nucleotidyltransferase
LLNQDWSKPLLLVLRDLGDWFQVQETPAVIIGGVAVGLLGQPRITLDVDVSVLVEEDHWPDFVAAGEQFGFVLRLSDALDFARQRRVLLMRHVPTETNVDIAFAWMPFEEQVISRAQTIISQGVVIRVATPEDLIIMKAVAHRRRDLLDIEAIVDSYPQLNRRRILRWVREFSAVLEMPEILADLQAILKRLRPKP